MNRAIFLLAGAIIICICSRCKKAKNYGPIPAFLSNTSKIGGIKICHGTIHIVMPGFPPLGVVPVDTAFNIVDTLHFIVDNDSTITLYSTDLSSGTIYYTPYDTNNVIIYTGASPSSSLSTTETSYTLAYDYVTNRIILEATTSGLPGTSDEKVYYP